MKKLLFVLLVFGNAQSFASKDFRIDCSRGSAFLSIPKDSIHIKINSTNINVPRATMKIPYPVVVIADSSSHYVSLSRNQDKIGIVLNKKNSDGESKSEGFVIYKIADGTRLQFELHGENSATLAFHDCEIKTVEIVTSFNPTSPNGTVWNNAWKATNGKGIWSDVLLKGYANCISEKDSNGNPKMDKGWAVCEKDENGHYLNAVRNGKNVFIEGLREIEKSDAIDACKEIGGVLPTKQDFINLGKDYLSMPNIYGYSYWSASFDGINVMTSTFIGENGQLGLFGYRPGLGSVRCLIKP